MKIYFDHFKKETAGISTFYFRPQAPFKYKPGQYIDLTLEHGQPDSRGIKRLFTLSSSPSESYLSITTKTDIPNPSTYTYALTKLIRGAELQTSAPAGSFVLPDSPRVPLLFIARGLGITPFRSMAVWLHDVGQKRDIHLFYDVASDEDLIFQDALAKAGIQTKVFIHSHTDGRAVHDLCQELKEIYTDDAQIYLGGSEKMVLGLSRELVSQDIPPSRLVIDAYVEGRRQARL